MYVSYLNVICICCVYIVSSCLCGACLYVAVKYVRLLEINEKQKRGGEIKKWLLACCVCISFFSDIYIYIILSKL